MANRMPMQPGDGGNPNGAQTYYYSQNGTPPQQMYLNFPIPYAQLQAINAQQVQYQNFLESQRRAQPDMRNRGQPQPQQQQQQQQQQIPGHPQQQLQQQQRLPGGPGYPSGHPGGGMEQLEGFDQKSQAEKDAMLDFIRSQGAAGKMFPQRGPLPPQQQRMPGMPGYSGANMDDSLDPNAQMEKDAMAELLRAQGGVNKPLQQRNTQQQQQRVPGMSGYPSGHPGGMDRGDNFEQKTQAEKDALLDLLRTQSGPAKQSAQQHSPRSQQQQHHQQQQQQQRAGLAPNMGETLPASAVGPHLDPAIAAAIPTGSSAAASNMQMSGGPVGGMRGTSPSMPGGPASTATAATTGPANTRGKIEVDDEYGLKPLVKVLAAAPVMSSTPHVPSPDEPTDPTTGRPISQQEADELNFSFITRGFDITQLGLSVSQQEWLHPTLATLPLDTHNYFILPEFKIPDSYKKPRPRSLSMKSFHQFKEETLFYIFYSMPRDVLHLAAARALYERGWRYHKRQQHWFRPIKMDDGTLMEKVTTGPDRQKIYTGVYNVFYPNEWKQVRTADNYTVSSNDVEEQSVLVAAMEEAARQQSYRSKAKAAQAATGAASNSSGSPTKATSATNV